jgi:hypothetical protein
VNQNTLVPPRDAPEAIQTHHHSHTLAYYHCFLPGPAFDFLFQHVAAGHSCLRWRRTSNHIRCNMIQAPTELGLFEAVCDRTHVPVIPGRDKPIARPGLGRLHGCRSMSLLLCYQVDTKKSSQSDCVVIEYVSTNVPHIFIRTQPSGAAASCAGSIVPR